MKIKRHKKFQRHIKFFEKQFRFRKPFQILVDGTFAQAALQNKVNLRDQLPKYFDGPVKLVTTACVLSETDWLGPELYGALQIMKTFSTHTCTHNENKAIGASKCILSMVKPDNPNRYVVATQDKNLKENARNIVGVPILYLHRQAPTLEKPSDVSTQAAETKNLETLEVADYQKELLTGMKTEAFGEIPVNTYKGTKKKQARGPNPLSCKKRKKPNTSEPSKVAKKPEDVARKKRKRIKRRIPIHVKQMKSGTSVKKEK